MTNSDKVIELIMDRVGDYTIRKWLRQLFVQYFPETSPSESQLTIGELSEKIIEKDARIKQLSTALKEIFNICDDDTNIPIYRTMEVKSLIMRLQLAYKDFLFIESKTKEG